jgi:hypothetical protein
MRSIFLRYKMVSCGIQATIPEVNMFMTQYKLLHDKIEYHTSLVISKIIDEDNIIAREVISEEGPKYLSDVEEIFVRSRYSTGKYRNMIWNRDEERNKEYILMFGEWEERTDINLDEHIHSR